MKKELLLVTVLCHCLAAAAQGNYVFSGAEYATLTNVDLATPVGQTWGTYRGAIPGYFSATGTATYTGASDAAHINGYVKHYADAANQAFTFPVGTGTDLRSLSLGGTIPASATYAAAWIAGDPGTTPDPTDPGSGIHDRHSADAVILGVSNAGQWDWQDISGNANGVTITVSVPDMTGFASTASDLRLVGWNGSRWVDLSGAATASGLAENSTLSGTMISGISAIGIGSLAFPLPVTLTSFDARAEGCQALLQWQTSHEKDFRGFDVEKSIDGRSFYSCGYQEARRSATGSDYQMNLGQEETQAYYRLKLWEENGSFSYSPVRTVRSDCRNDISHIRIYPNPVVTGNGQVTISFRSDYKGIVHVAVTNTLGRQLFKETLPATIDGIQTLVLPTSQLSSATYYIQVTDAGGQTLFPAATLVKY